MIAIVIAIGTSRQSCAAALQPRIGGMFARYHPGQKLRPLVIRSPALDAPATSARCRARCGQDMDTMRPNSAHGPPNPTFPRGEKGSLNGEAAAPNGARLGRDAHAVGVRLWAIVTFLVCRLLLITFTEGDETQGVSCTSYTVQKWTPPGAFARPTVRCVAAARWREMVTHFNGELAPQHS